MRHAANTLVVSHRLAIALVFTASPTFAQVEAKRPNQGIATTATQSPFAGEVLRRAVETALRAPASTTKQPRPAPTGRDSLWNGVLIGAGIGAVAGGWSAAADDCGHDGPDYGGGCDLLAGAAIGGGMLAGGLMGAGVGAFVDWLIR